MSSRSRRRNAPTMSAGVPAGSGMASMACSRTRSTNSASRDGQWRYSVWRVTRARVASSL